MSVKIQFNVQSLLAAARGPRFVTGEDLTVLANQEGALLNLATGEPFEMCEHDPIIGVNFTIHEGEEKDKSYGVIHCRDAFIGGPQYVEMLRGILDTRELQQLERLGQTTQRTLKDAYFKGGDRSRVSDEIIEMTKLSTIPETDEIEPENCSDVWAGYLLSAMISLAEIQGDLVRSGVR